MAAEQTEATAPEQTVPSDSEYAVQDSKTAEKSAKQNKAMRLKANDKHGFALTIMSMCVVLGALTILSILFLFFGKISKNMHKRNKMAAKGISTNGTNMEIHTEELDSGEVIAAIATAISQHFNAHDQENYDLTIKRMKRAYSPWNSKIYNMRETPMIRKFFK